MELIAPIQITRIWAWVAFFKLCCSENLTKLFPFENRENLILLSSANAQEKHNCQSQNLWSRLIVDIGIGIIKLKNISHRPNLISSNHVI